MTPAELTALAREVFSKVPHPERPNEKWWTPEQMCDNWILCPLPRKYMPSREGGIEVDHQMHEIPTPNPMDWAVFGQLLMWASSVGLDLEEGRCVVTIWPPTSDTPFHAEADDPRIALLLAVAMLKEQR